MDGGAPLVGWVISSLLLSMRIAPVFAFAPPFSLTRVPPLFRVLFAFGGAGLIAAGQPGLASTVDVSLGRLLVAAVRELALGSVIVLAFHLCFGAIQFVGRTIDIQAGFGLAAVIDPTTRQSAPLVGSLFAYTAAAIFFAMDGHAQLLRIFAASLEAAPLGGGGFPGSLDGLQGYISVVFLAAFGVGGGAILCLFLADVAITALSRTIPQMNVLVLGLQVKALLTLVVLPVTFAVSGALLARLMVILLDAAPEFF